jgi:hypothetical protein
MTPDEAAEMALINLLDKGAVAFEGFDETGEPIYRFTEKLKDVAPDLYNMHMSMLNVDVMALWEKGFVDMDLFEDNPKVKLTSKAFDKNEIKKLNETLYNFLEQIKKMYHERP